MDFHRCSFAAAVHTASCKRWITWNVIALMVGVATVDRRTLAFGVYRGLQLRCGPEAVQRLDVFRLVRAAARHAEWVFVASALQLSAKIPPARALSDLQV